jgi:hypothetical protein
MKKLLVVSALLLFAGIAFGQTLQKGGTVAIHEYTVTLAPDVTMDQFMDFFVDKYIPEANKLLEGVKLFALKGDRGEHENGIAMLVWCESTDARNMYWPEEGAGSSEYTAANEKLQPVTDELLKLGTFNTAYTEWLIQ